LSLFAPCFATHKTERYESLQLLVTESTRLLQYHDHLRLVVRLQARIRGALVRRRAKFLNSLYTTEELKVYGRATDGLMQTQREHLRHLEVLSNSNLKIILQKYKYPLKAEMEADPSLIAADDFAIIFGWIEVQTFFFFLLFKRLYNRTAHLPIGNLPVCTRAGPSPERVGQALAVCARRGQSLPN
jgi:hypothetical protein